METEEAKKEKRAKYIVTKSFGSRTDLHQRIQKTGRHL